MELSYYVVSTARLAGLSHVVFRGRLMTLDQFESDPAGSWKLAPQANDRHWKGYGYFVVPEPGETESALKKTVEHVRLGDIRLAWVLVPARTDSAWWFRYAKKASTIVFIPARLKRERGKKPIPVSHCCLVFSFPLVTAKPPRVVFDVGPPRFWLRPGDRRLARR